ncbi:hypothetical protein ACTFRP_02485 [Bacillus cereus group sp. MYBK234-1]|uniref:hypothetical protein n=1 Tax=unclassified Bacillus cereus group TaxID=2750818 RepID=UPI003F794F3F
MLKKIVVSTLALGLTVGVGVEYASAASLDTSSQTIYKAIRDEEADPDLLLNETKKIKRSGKISFDYHFSEEGAMRVYVENVGNYPFTFKLVDPDGDAIMSGIELEPGESFRQKLYVPNPTSKDDRTYYFHFKNDDGQRIEVYARAVAL